jgi:hypothetical protein
MFIPNEVVLAFKKPDSLFVPPQAKAPVTKQAVEKPKCPPGYNRNRITTLISKPSRGHPGTFVDVFYRKLSPEFVDQQKLAKFEIFNNPSLWS